jgi:tryptophan synthase alpha chain
LFYPYIPHQAVKLIGVEAAGEGLETGRHAASLCAGKPGVLHGNRTYLLQDANGQITETHSISAGLDYPGVGPEHAWLKDSRRAQYVAVTDAEALHAFHELCRCEGIIPALESAHAVAHAMKLAPSLPADSILLVNLSGRGDKDMHTVAELRAAKRKALIPYITAGDPHPQLTVPLMRALVEGGADILELGVPFSDPMADGPVIQRSGERALKHGVGLADVLNLVVQFRKADTVTPLVLMGYANPIEAMGTARFVAAAREAGVDGVIVVDYPPEECAEFAQLLRAQDIDPVFLLAPTSSDKRIHDVARVGSGYIYYVSLRGVTGAAHLDLAEVSSRIPKIRAATRLPIGVGFGIRDAESARRVAQTADAVVIGSRIIQEIEAGNAEQAVTRVKNFLLPIRKALDA